LTTFRWLHLSDIHFKEEERWDTRATLRALQRKLGELIDAGCAPDLVFVTGDIAFSGKAREYEQATRFFKELNGRLKLDPKDRWFLVPGNHDVDRSRIKKSHRTIVSSLTSEESVEETLKDSETMRLLSARLEAYHAFAADFLGPARSLQPDRPWRTDVREFGGASIGILQLNSAWTAEGGPDDEAKLLVGEAQLREAIDETPDAFIRIALMHHPMRSLRDFDENRVQGLLAKGGATFLLRGHMHLSRTTMQSAPGQNLLEIAAGALYTPEKDWPRGFNIGELDLEKGEARIQLFRYSDSEEGFFAPDNLTYEDAPKGIARLKLPRRYRFAEKETAAVRRPSREQQRNFTSRYRTAAANYHGNARFIGFPNQAARPNARISDLFVPLRLRSYHSKSEEITSTAAIAQRLLACKANQPPARIVILGDPGSGKTTLSRFMVMLAAKTIALPGVDITGEPLPLRIAFRDFVEKQRENRSLSLLEYLEQQAKVDLSITLPRGFIEKAIKDGRAVLLLDGLDEVGTPEHRAAMCDLLESFCAMYLCLPVLVTSRIAGYDEAPLGTIYIAGEDLYEIEFDTLALEPFDDDDLHTFVQRWYEIQEPNDPVARDKGIKELLDALAADERVRELARTPILATLIAMIHRVEANLPGERAKLYELCVRMLLETWPAQRGRKFTELDDGLQRAYLESLAFEIQKRRSARATSVTIAHADLIAVLTPILQKRDFFDVPEEVITRIIARWIEHLEQHCGLIVEQTTGVYAFFHLSILEYLAAQGMQRELDQGEIVNLIDERLGDPQWTEVCLLVVGSQAQNPQFLDALFERLKQSEGFLHAAFLIACLREEARFSNEQRIVALNRYTSELLETGYYRWRDSLLLEQILRFSNRHAAAVQAWIDAQLQTAVGDELLKVAAAIMPRNAQRVQDIVGARPDCRVAVASLLELWPESVIGDWAADVVGAEAALEHEMHAPIELLTVRGVATVTTQVSMHTAAALAMSNVAHAADTLAIAHELTDELPKIVGFMPGPGAVATAPSLPLDFTRRSTIKRRRMRSLSWALTDDFVFVLEGLLTAELTVRTNFFRIYGMRSGPRRLAPLQRYADKLEYEFDVPSSFYLVSLQMTHMTIIPEHGVPKIPKRLVDWPWQDLFHADALDVVTSFNARLGAEAWIAFVATRGNDSEAERLQYLDFRIHNRWLYEVWPAIDDQFSSEPSAGQIAAYLALGWIQATTTHLWPDTPRWNDIINAGPPNHWFPRTQWHLCNLTKDRQSSADIDGLREALTEGERDQSLPGYAAKLREILAIPE